MSSDVASVSDDAFASCTKLSAISVPPEIIMISSKAFSSGCDPVVVCDKGSFADSALSNSLNVSFNRGDCNVDGYVDVMDATNIQRYIAKDIDLPLYNLAFADADFDAEVTVLDASYVQRFIAELL